MKITGFFKIDSKDENNNIVDTYEHQNTIMDAGREDVMSWLHGMSDGTSEISKLILGEGGYNGGAGPAIFTSNRTNTFSEANGDAYYYLNFLTDPTTGNTSADLNAGKGEEGTPAVNSVVTITQDNTAFTLTYRFQIPQSNANGSGVRQYSEAAMYCSNAPDAIERIFAMRTFPSRAKDSTISYDIEWTISFG